MTTMTKMRAALEAAEHWLAEEAESKEPGATKPDEILRVIRSALGKEAQCMEDLAEAAAERAATAKGWRLGGDYIYDSNVFDSWKEAVSWSGDDGRDEREQSSNIYSTWVECCHAEDIEYGPEAG